MPGLIRQIEQAVGALDLTQLAGSTGAQYAGLGKAIAGWSQGAPGDFGAALGDLAKRRLPELSIAGGLGQGFALALPSLQGDLGGLVARLGGDVTALPLRLKTDLAGALRPLVQRIEMLRTLLASDWSCGLVPGFAPEAAAPAPAPGPAPAPSPAPAAPAPTAAAALTPAQVAAAKALVDKLPADLGVASLLPWLHARVGTFRPGYFTLRSLPLVDDIRDPLDTLVRWDGASPAAVQAEIGQTLVSLAAVVRANVGGRLAAALPAAAVAGGVPGAALGSAAENFVAATEALAAAAQAGNPAALPGAFGAAQAARAALLAQNSAAAAAAEARARLASRLAALPGELDAGICRLLVLLQPRATLADVADAIGPFQPPALPADAFAPLTDVIAQLQGQLQSLLDAVDIAAVTGPIAQALAGADAAVRSVEQTLAQLSAQALQSIGAARTALQAFDLNAVRHQAEAAIQGATDQVAAAVGAALGPASAALGDAMTQVFTAIDGVDPEALAAPLREAIEALGAVVQDEAVQRLVEVADALRELAQTIATLSFEPVADEVIALIGELKTLLEGIDIESLPDPGPALIGEAMKVLPPSLVPLTDPLVVDLDGLIAASPIALLEQVKTLPDQARAQLLAYSPRRALEPVLARPFREAVAGLERFSPNQWLAQGDAALAGLRQQLVAQLDIAALLAEPSRAFAGMAGRLDALRPSTLLAPVEKAIEDAVAGIAQALPADDLGAALSGALARFTGFTATVRAALDVASHLTGKLGALGDAPAQFEAWLAAILVKVPETATGALATTLADLRDAALEARPAALAAAWSAARAPLAAALQQADATGRLTRLALARSRLLAALSPPVGGAAVPGLAAWLDEAATRSAGDGLAALAALDRALAGADAGLADQLIRLGIRFPAADGALAPLLPPGPAALRAWVRQAVQRQLGVPLLALLASLKPVAALVEAGVTALRGLVDAVDAKLAVALAAPQALADLLGSVDAVAKRLSGLDLGLYTREIDSVFAALADQVHALDPAGLQAPLVAARDRLLGQLTLTALLPAPLRGQLDSAQRQLIAKLGSIDPDKLLLAPLDAEYRATVEPLVAALDISATVQIVIDWLKALPADLRLQIGRVDEPYGALLRSAPGGGGASASVGVGI